MTRTKMISAVATLALVVGAFAVPAFAAKGGNGGGHGKDKLRQGATRMKFKLDDHQLALGEAATGEVTLQTRVGKSWTPFAGASLEVTMDDTDCGSVTTDAEGKATATCTATADGEYVMKVRYAGDETHKKAQRAQGFSVGDGDEEVEDVLPEVPAPDPSVSPTTI
jgi:hypothetical protein